jgi:hypothetical protein
MSYNTLEQLRQYGATLKELENCGDATAPTYAELYSGEWEHPRASGHGC